MIFKELKYKQEAIGNLLNKVNKFLEVSGEKTCVLKSPTGSGKTIMMAEFLSRLVTDRKDDRTFSFIWAAPRKLHEQSKEKLEQVYSETRILECSNIEDLTDRKINENEILFLNWESINKKDNVFVSENEIDFNLTSVVENTLGEGREIVLIIDESHHTSTAPNTRGLIEIMKPKITIGVSATPPEIGVDYIEEILFEDVVAEGMIKKEVAINSGLKDDKLEGEGSDEFILKEALRKREELKEYFKEIGKDINPLLLIQLPDKKRHDNEDSRKEKMIEDLLYSKFSITRENGKLAFYLSEDKENLENITISNNETEVLVFKQAIALGWDCPRAYILVLFREWHSETFKIQTVGRIMRMPELKHYKNEALNKGYVYTNIANTKIDIEENIARDYFTIFTATRKNSYENIDLISYHTLRQRETTRLNPSFISIFLSECDKSRLNKKLNLKVIKVVDLIPVDATLHLEYFNTLREPVEMMKDISLAKTTLELEMALKYFIDKTMREGKTMFPESRSVGRVITAIYEFFSFELDMKYEEKEKEIISIVLHKDNQQHFIDAINLALKEYAKHNPPKKNKVVENDELWNVPESIDLNANHEQRKPAVKNSILNPFYLSKSKAKHWNTEEQFIDFLDKHKKVEWWLKNGERDATFFAVPYQDSYGEPQVFYVDFIVKLDDERIGLFDTKSGWTAKDAGPRSNGLQKYIAEQNKKGKNLTGSIVVPKGGSFWIYDKIPYKYDKELTGWSVLEF